VPVPDIVRQTLQKFYEKRPEDRFQDAAEADRALMACEDALRPPSANVAVASVLPYNGEATFIAGKSQATQEAGSNAVRTMTLTPQKAVEAPGAPARQADAQANAEGKASSSVSVAPSLVTNRPAVPEPPLIAEPELTRPPPSPVPPAPTPLETVPRARASGNGALFAVLGIAGLLLLAGLGGAVWAWKSGRLSGLIPSAHTPADPGAVAVQPPSDPGTDEPTEPPRADPTPSEPEPTTVAGTDTPTEPTNDDEPESEAAAGEGDAADEVEEPEAEPTPPPAEQLAAGCYSVTVAFESNRKAGGKYTPWMPASVDGRTPIRCSAVPNRGEINNAQGLYDHWPNAPEELLSAKTLSFVPQVKGAPDTRRMVVKAYTRVSEGSR